MLEQIISFVRENLIPSAVIGFIIFFQLILIIVFKSKNKTLIRSNDSLLDSIEKTNNSNTKLKKLLAERTERLAIIEKSYTKLEEESKKKVVKTKSTYSGMSKAYNEILKYSPTGIIKLDENLTVEYENPTIEKILGIPSKAIPNFRGINIRKIAAFQETDMIPVFNYILKGRKAEIETIFLNHLKKKTYAKVIGIPLYNENRFDGAILLINDVTEQLHAEEKLRQSIDMQDQATNDIVKAMISISEIRDPYTANHQRRVCELSEAIAQEMGMESERIKGIGYTARIHDIGKVAVPSDILTKPGKISDMEFNVIMNHSKVGFDILKNIRFPWPIAEIVYQHHERMDGSGYPRNLTKKQILMEARIIGLADVVEAIASHRPYRAALGIEKAMKEISNKRGSYFDESVVDACLKIFKEKKFKFTEEGLKE